MPPRSSDQNRPPRKPSAQPGRDVAKSHPPRTSRPQRTGSRKGPPKSREEEFLEQAAQYAEPWDEERTKFKPVLVLHGNTYQPAPLFDVAPYAADPEKTPAEHLVRSPSGEFAYMNRIWKCGDAIPLLQNTRQGLVYWDTDVIIPVLLNGRDLSVWMSLTPMEVFTLREGISRAKGTVIIGGLGMGYLLRKVCEKTSVERVIVVEQSRELLDWFGNRLCAAQPKVTDIICGDAYDQLGKFGPEARYLFDIWPIYTDAALDERFQEAKKTYPHVWGWGDYILEEEDEDDEQDDE